MPRVAQDLLSNILNISEKFPVTYRLSRKDGFNQVLNAEKISDKCFKIFFISNCEKNARLGIITSKKMFPKAVNRNSIKREIRETFRKHSIKFSSMDIVVMVSRTYSQHCVTQSKNLEMLFSRLENRCAEL